MTKRPVGLIRYLVSFNHALGNTGLMISSITASMKAGFIFFPSLISGACWLESTTVSMLCGLPST